METAPRGAVFYLQGNVRRASELLSARSGGRHWTCRNKHPSARQRLLQLPDGNIRGRGTVGRFKVPQKYLQSRFLVPDDPAAREHLSVMKARDPNWHAGAGKAGIEIVAGWEGHF